MSFFPMNQMQGEFLSLLCWILFEAHSFRGKPHEIKMNQIIELFYCCMNCSDSDEEVDMKNRFQMCTNLVNQALIDQAAYIRACAAAKKLDLDSHKSDIRKEMKNRQKKSKRCSDFEPKQCRYQLQTIPLATRK